MEKKEVETVYTPNLEQEGTAKRILTESRTKNLPKKKTVNIKDTDEDLNLRMKKNVLNTSAEDKNRRRTLENEQLERERISEKRRKKSVAGLLTKKKELHNIKTTDFDIHNVTYCRDWVNNGDQNVNDKSVQEQDTCDSHLLSNVTSISHNVLAKKEKSQVVQPKLGMTKEA